MSYTLVLKNGAAVTFDADRAEIVEGLLQFDRVETVTVVKERIESRGWFRQPETVKVERKETVTHWVADIALSEVAALLPADGAAAADLEAALRAQATKGK